MRLMLSSASRTRRLILAAILTALALALLLIDTSISAFLAFIPGFKLGLANIVTLFALYYLGMSWACLILGVRCILGAVFGGQITMLFFSLMGGYGSLIVMFLLRERISVIKVSMAGGVTHNLMQLVAAALVTSTPAIAGYMPVLIVLGTVTGLSLGIVCRLVFRSLRGAWVMSG